MRSKNTLTLKDYKKKLSECDARFNALFRSAHDIVVLLESSGKIIDANKRLFEIGGYKAKDYIGRNISSLYKIFTPSSIALILANFAKRMLGVKIKPYEVEARSKTGKKLSFILSAFPLKGQDGKFKGEIAVLHDITGRKRAEEEVKQKREELSLILDSLPIIVFYKDRKGKIIRANKTFAKALKMSEENLVGKTVFNLYSAKVAQSMTDDDEMVMRSGRPKLDIIEKYESAGGIRWVRTDKVPIYGANNKVVGLVGFAQDITERKQAEEALERSEERFRQVAQNTGEWIWEVDIKGLYTYSNPVVKEILGYKPEEIVGKKYFYDFFAPEDREEFKKQAFEVFAKKQTFRKFVNPNIKKNGQLVHLETSGTPILDEKGKLLGYRGADCDVTERKTMEEAKDKLIQGVSHTLKTPIALMEMAREMAIRAEKENNAQKVKKADRIILSNLQTLKRDVENILDIFTIGVRKELICPTLLSGVVGEAAQELKPLLDEKNIKLKISLLPDADKIMAAQKGMLILLRNILDNAIKFSKRGNIIIASRRIRDKVLLTIRDFGVGIEVRDKNKLFDRFYKGASAMPGIGLGLAITKEIVDLCGGTIKIESAGKNKGTTVRVVFLAAPAGRRAGRRR